MVETQTTEEALLHRVAENIGKRRRALGLTQAQLAERLGVDAETLSRFERGRHSPTLKNLARLAGLLQTTVSDLLAEERQQPSDNSTIISQSLARVNLATVYKLYRYAPEVRDVIVSRYPDCIAQEKEDKKKEKADRKQEEEDLRSSRPRQVRTVSVKKKKKAVPESWDATVEEDQEFSSGIENKSSQED